MFETRYKQENIRYSIDSEIKPVKYRVAEGSILGLLLLLFRVNDLPNLACSLSRLFVDDTSLILTSNTIPSLQAIMNLDLQKVSHWYMDNVWHKI